MLHHYELFVSVVEDYFHCAVNLLSKPWKNCNLFFFKSKVATGLPRYWVRRMSLIWDTLYKLKVSSFMRINIETLEHWKSFLEFHIIYKLTSDLLSFIISSMLLSPIQEPLKLSTAWFIGMNVIKLDFLLGTIFSCTTATGMCWILLCYHQARLLQPFVLPPPQQ